MSEIWFNQKMIKKWIAMIAGHGLQSGQTINLLTELSLGSRIISPSKVQTIWII